LENYALYNMAHAVSDGYGSACSVSDNNGDNSKKTKCLRRIPIPDDMLRQDHTHRGKDGKTSVWMVLLSGALSSTMLLAEGQVDLPIGDLSSY
jgi:hypothetical protein